MNSYTFSTHDDKFLITSYGNGWAYEVRCLTTDYAFFVQDDNAEEVRIASEGFEDTYVLSEMMSVVGEPDREVV